MADGVDLLGFDRLISELEQMGLRGEKIEDRVLAAGGEPIRKAIAERAPRSDSPKKPSKSEPWRTGQHGADHIKVTKARLEDGIKTVKIGIDKADRSPWFYLKFHEWGTSKMPAHPFVEPGFNASKAEAVRIMTNILKDEMRLNL
ncbi:MULTISPECIES: HK97-gp10 family putative phage morphogenesis protein [Bacillus cereus group]|uniref:HK97-gp10 family putative phage morphogenesis protein n=1 Tax=Bacillus cereus group TaxID=86661 RepID=UPI0013D6460C|nr:MULTISPECIES: HK97-gp10 family putative phage morphogenesis protein [Bacillus cereus group]MDA1548003.1 HK97 gp10 family phage protein [Bacillus cereus group sp. TH253LC]HDR7777690.1 HK97 gp10 family phage protein [Bacillus tropicus]